MLSDSEADYDAYDNLSERAQNKLLSPNFLFFRWYATFMLFMLLIFVFYMPVRVAFFPRERWAVVLWLCCAVLCGCVMLCGGWVVLSVVMLFYYEVSRQPST